MIKLLIVDDEENTREGLKNFVPWSTLGIDDICLAGDGVAALDVFDKEDPDIILCDVRMPRMNGIEFAQSVKEKKPGCKIIFLSGFSDKEYLKSAIKLGATDYIEKPVIMSELKAVMGKTVKMLGEEKLYRIKIDESMMDFKKNLVDKLISPDVDFAELRREIIRVGGRFLDKKTFTVVTVLFTFEMPKKEIAVLCDQLTIFLPDTLFGFINPSSLVIIQNDSDETYRIRMAFKELADRILGSSNQKHFTIGIGMPVVGIENIALSYNTAAIACKKQFFTSYESMIYYDRMNDAHYSFDHEQISLYFKKCLMENEKQEALDTISKLTADISRNWGTDVDYVKHIMLNLYLALHDVSILRDIEKVYSENSRDYFWKKIGGFGTLGEVSDYLKWSIDEFYTDLGKKDSVDTKTDKLEAFIEKYYGDKDLSMKRMSHHVDLSLNYMCGMFKKETGSTINDYLVETRIRKAGEMLKDRDMRIYEIADRTGFKATNYFSRLFKKKTGLTPSEYREKYLV